MSEEKYCMFLSYGRGALLHALSNTRKHKLLEAAADYEKALRELESEIQKYGVKDNPLARYFSEAGNKIFISHDDDDKEQVMEIKGEFEKQHPEFPCFVAHSSLPRGKIWIEELFRELNEASFFVAIITPKFNQSAFCHQETGIAKQRGIPIYPIRIGDTEREGFLKDYQGNRADLKNTQKIVELIWKFIRDNCME